MSLVVPSPDGRHFFFISRHSDIERGDERYELEVFASQHVLSVLPDLSQKDRRSRVRAVASATLRCLAPTEPAIQQPRWEPDSRAVLFMGTAEEGTQQICRLDVCTGKLRQLTTHPVSIVSFAFRGGGLVFTARHGNTLRTYTSYNGGAPQSLSLIPDRDAWISPDGKRAVLLVIEPDGTRQFALVDVPRGRVSSILGLSPATVSTLSPMALWSADSGHVVLVNATVSVADGNTVECLDDSAYVLAYEVDRGQWKVLEPLVCRHAAFAVDAPASHVTSVGWLPGDKELLVTHESGGQATTGTVYTLHGGESRGRTADASVELPEPGFSGGSAPTLHRVNAAIAAAASTEYSSFMRQSANAPPPIVASVESKQTSRSKPNPAFDPLWPARVQPLEWKEADGHIAKGGLVLPRDHYRSPPLPLVVQASHYSPNESCLEGSGPEPDVAQALAAQGIAVLLLETTHLMDHAVTSAKEGPFFVARIDAAVDALVKRGIIDPSRVGIVGFSRGGYQTYYAITHPGQTPLAAAVSVDSFTASFIPYDSHTAGERPHTFELLNGGNSWQKKNKWLEYETTFNVDRVATPALFTTQGSGDLHTERHVIPIGAFQLNDKPFEFLYFPDGAHRLQGPYQRTALTQAIIDWMTFWLQGYEDPEPQKAAQYIRWRVVRCISGALSTGRRNIH